MVWYSLIGLASLKELEAFIKSRQESALAQPRLYRSVGFAAAHLAAYESCPFESRIGRIRE